jgi:hypothetical protein
LELEWQAALKRNDNERITKAAGNGSIHVFTYCGSLRGFETPKILLCDLHHQTLSSEESASDVWLGNYTPPHASLPLIGRFKARYQEEQRRIIDISWETSSDLQPGVWAKRLIEALENCGATRGLAYQRRSDNTQMKMSEFSDCFFGMLLDIQQDRSDLVAPDIDVVNDFGLSRSERRGAKIRAQAVKVPEDIINWTKRWNIGEDDVVHGPMGVVYLERTQMMETYLAFSLPL